MEEVSVVVTLNKKSPARGWWSSHGLLWPTCNHSHKLLASVCAEIKCRGFSWFQHFANL